MEDYNIEQQKASEFLQFIKDSANQDIILEDTDSQAFKDFCNENNILYDLGENN